MKAHASYHVPTMGYDIYIELSGEGSAKWFLDDTGTPRLVELGHEAPVYMRIPEPVAKALGEVLNPSEPPATERHLDAVETHMFDARETRDRLLTLVEKLWEAPR